MATNYVQPGKILDLTAPYDRTTGQGFQVGSIFAVALGTALSGAAIRGQIDGVWTLEKTSAQAWTVGQKIYWDNSNKRCDSDSTVGQLIGVATAVAANPSSTGQVRLNGGAPATAEGPQGAIVALTDNTGGSGTHDDTLADGLTSVAPSAYSAPAAGGAVAVLSAAATDLDTAAAALANVRGVVATLVTDVTTINQNTSDLAQKINEIRTALIAAGILASS